MHIPSIIFILVIFCKWTLLLALFVWLTWPSSYFLPTSLNSCIFVMCCRAYNNTDIRKWEARLLHYSDSKWTESEICVVTHIYIYIYIYIYIWCTPRLGKHLAPYSFIVIIAVVMLRRELFANVDPCKETIHAWLGRDNKSLSKEASAAVVRSRWPVIKLL